MTIADLSERLRRMSVRSVLFVCTGNTCRSAMAAAWLRSHLARRGGERIDVESAGTAAFPGEPMPPQAEFALFREGIDRSAYASHRSREVTEELLAKSDVVFVMTHAHREDIRRRFPQFAGRVYTLMELVGSRADVGDPFGGDSERYIRCLEQMKPALTRLLDALTAKADAGEWTDG